MRYGQADTQVVLQTLFLSSPTLPTPINIDLTQSADALAKLKKEPSEPGSILSARCSLMAVTIKEGVDYSVGITFV